jgi:hypothetical protein
VVTTKSGASYDVYVGRAGQGQDGYFGNPFSVAQYGLRALPLFRRYFLQRLEVDKDYREAVLGLRGKVLGCPGATCGSGPCHAKIMAEWINGQPVGEG